MIHEIFNYIPHIDYYWFENFATGFGVTPSTMFGTWLLANITAYFFSIIFFSLFVKLYRLRFNSRKRII